MPMGVGAKGQTGTRGVQIVGRGAELAALDEFVGAEHFPRALVVSGRPGIGKTTLWEAGIAAARGQGMRVLSTRASAAEAQLSFGALIDLLTGVDLRAFVDLPAPQLHALEVALLRADPGDAPLESRAVALGFLNVLRLLASDGPLLLAVDDVQWLDPPSADALVFASRRLEGRRVAFLLAKRRGCASALERALGPARLQDLEVGSLSLGAIRHLLSERLGLSLPRHVLRRLVEATLGNPLFALEVGRTLAEQGLPAIGEEIPVPDAVEDLLGTRVARLPGPARRLLLAVSLSADLRRSQLGAIAEAASVEDAVDAGLLVVDGDRVRASHPLLAAAARKHSRSRARRELHLELAHVVADEQLRARHLALATEHPDAELAAVVAAASAGAGARGATQDAVVLAVHALRLTPPESAERPQRLLELAHYLAVAGEKQRVTDLLSAELESLPPGAARARAWLIMPGGTVASNDEIRLYLERALAESLNDPALHAAVLGNLSTNASTTRVEQIHEAEAWAEEALPAARRGGPEIERSVLYALAWARSMRGLPLDDVCRRFDAASAAVSYILGSPERIQGQRLVWRGEVGPARPALTALLSLADERGEAVAHALLRLHVCELELRIGRWAEAACLLDEWAEPSERELLPWPMYERCRALLAAGRGLPAKAERWAAKTIERARAAGVRYDELEALRARGIAALLEHEPARAADALRAVHEHTRREGVDEPGAFPVAPDLVEALVELGELEEAREVTTRLRELAEQQEHPWGRATAKRCLGLVRLAAGSYDAEAAGMLTEAAADYEQLGLQFDAARTLLSAGRAERRSKKWARARESLEQAAAAFEGLESPGWAEEARSELGRVGARRPRAERGLTPTEQRVVRLAAEGRSNKEIAHALFVTVHTVEVHLSHAYAKLGVRSRGQLAGRLSARG